MQDPSALKKEPWFDSVGYPFSSHYLELPAGRLHYLDEGPPDGELVFLIHGTPGWSYEYRELVLRLRARYRVVAPDLIGFGLSERSQTFSYSLPDHTAVLKALFDHVAPPGSRPARLPARLIVHDYGGPVGLPLLLDDPQRFGALVLMNTFLWPLSIDLDFKRRQWMVRGPLLRFFYSHFNFSARVMVKASWGKRTPLTRERHQRFLGMFPDRESRIGTLGFLRATYSTDDYMESLWQRRQALHGRPVLIVWGDADKFIGGLHLDRWRSELPSAEVHVLPDVGHFPHDEAPEEVGALIERFFAKGSTP